MNDKFFKTLDTEVRKQWKKIISHLTDDLHITGFEFEVILSDETLHDFGLNPDIRFLIKATPRGGETKYHYKGIPIDPQGYYILPDDYREAPTIEILLECIKQDSFKPDIKHLQHSKS